MSTYKGLPTNIGPLPKTFEEFLTPSKSNIPNNLLNPNALIGTHVHIKTGERYLQNKYGKWIKENLDPDNKSQKNLDIFSTIAKIPTTKYPQSAIPPATPRLDSLPHLGYSYYTTEYVEYIDVVDDYDDDYE